MNWGEEENAVAGADDGQKSDTSKNKKTIF